jgi:histidinol dehydrogenase
MRENCNLENCSFKVIKAPCGDQNADFRAARDAVSAIIDDVREHGDAALARYTAKFDGSTRTTWRVGREEIEAAKAQLAKSELENMRLALNNIRAFAEAQMATISDLPMCSLAPGLEAGHRIVPVDAALCYVPGGGYPLYSTALMLTAPAKIAGVARVAACSPVMRGGSSVNPKTLAALDLAGADEIYALGGAQAIAAFAYGTEQIVPVDLIVGPGNSYVAEAKRQCYGQVGIDFVAGPSEVLIIADSGANPRFIAADLLAQCEHDKLAQGILVTTDENLAKTVLDQVEQDLKSLKTASIAAVSWKNRGCILVADTLDEAIAYANVRAPEHLELHCENPDAAAEKLRNYGSLFLGSYSAEVFGDYAAGPNHTLPTMRAGRYTGGLWVGTFVKTLSVQRLSPAAAAAIAPLAASLAEGEGLFAHAHAAKARM